MRNYVKIATLCILATVLTISIMSEESTRSSGASLQALLDGNKRFRTNTSLYSRYREENPDKSFLPQKPIAAVLSCSDSRVPPEILFDQWVGDLFVVRTAGNIADAAAIDSLEFATRTLKAPLIVVLGHSDCGAVTAVLNNQAKEFDIENIAPFIQPAVEKSKKLYGNSVEDAIKMNVYTIIDTLKGSPVIKKLIDKKKLTIVPAYYDLKSQQVIILPENQ